MSVDWGAIGRASQAPSSGPGAVDWGGVAKASPIHVSQSAGSASSGGGGGGGGLLDSIGGFIGHELGQIPGEHAVASGLHGAGYVTRNLAKDVGSWISAIPELPGAVVRFNRYDARHYPLTLNPIQAYHELIGSYHDPHSIGGGMVRPTVESVKTDVGNVVHGNWHALAQHPLSPILDVAAGWTLGGRAALGSLKFADQAGMLAKGGRAARLADDTARILKDEKLAETLPRSRTLQGRMIQNVLDRYAQAHPEAPMLGAQSRLVKLTGKHSYYRTQAELALTRKFQRAGKPLTRAEEFATHIAAEPIPYRDRVALYEKLNAESPSKALQQYIRVMKQPAVKEALTNPRPEFAQFTHEAKALEARGGQILTEAQKLTPEIRAARAAAPADFAREHGIPIGPTDIHPSLAQDYRFPHVGTTGNPSAFRTPLGKLAGPREPGMLKRSKLIRFARSQFLTNPQAVLGQDFMGTSRYLHELDQQEHILTPASRALDATKHEATYGKPQDGSFYWPAKAQAAWRARREGKITAAGERAPRGSKMAARRSVSRANPTGIPRTVRDQPALEQDRAVLDTATHQAGVEAAAKNTVSESLHDLGHLSGTSLEGKTIEQLSAMGVRWLPKAYARAYQQEFGRANAMARLFIDKPTDFWRSLTLKYRPAWAVNNMLGQHLLYAMANPTLGGAAAYGKAVAGHRRNMETFEGLPGMRQGFATTQKGITHTGGAQAIVDRSAVLRTARAIGLPLRAVAKPIQKVGDTIQFFNQLGENIPREAQFLHLIKDKIDLTNKTLAEAVHTADPKVVQRVIDEVNSLQGDFGHLSHFERTFLRRALPFYSWFKVITKLTAKYAVSYPLRAKMLQANAAFLNEPNAKMPSYLQGFIRLFENSKEVTGLSTVGANPFQTVPQLIGAAGSAIGGGKGGFGTDNPGGLLNPLAQAGITGISGTDLFTGSAYRGPGAGQNDVLRALGQFTSNLPEYRLAEQATGKGPKSSLYSQQHFAGLPPYLWNYLGLPVRRVKKAEAASRAKAGQ